MSRGRCTLGYGPSGGYATTMRYMAGLQGANPKGAPKGGRRLSFSGALTNNWGGTNKSPIAAAGAFCGNAPTASIRWSTVGEYKGGLAFLSP